MTLLETPTLQAPILVRADDVPWQTLKNRPGQHLKEMSVAPDGQSLRFRAVVNRLSSEFHAPRHHHTFDQVRFTLSGRVRIGEQVYTPGDLGYFPEGVKYGPQPSIGTEHGDLVQASIQMPGPSQVLYLTPDEQYAAVEELSKTGTFVDGMYERDAEVVDGFEAMVRHVTGERVRYPVPRYHEPIQVKTDVLPWVPLHDGVDLRHVGYFNESGPNIKLARLARGARLAPTAHDWQEYRFVTAGALSCDRELFPAVSFMYVPGHLNFGEMVAGEQGATVLQIQVGDQHSSMIPFV